MSIDKIHLRTIMSDPRNGLGDAYDDNCVYFVVDRNKIGAAKYTGCEVVADCVNDNEEDLVLLKRKKDGQGV